MDIRTLSAGQCNSENSLLDTGRIEIGHPPKGRRQKTSDESRLGMNTIPFTGEIPRSWRKTLLQLQPKTKIARAATEFRPIANIKLMYKTFACFVLDQIEQPLENFQPEQ